MSLLLCAPVAFADPQESGSAASSSATGAIGPTESQSTGENTPAPPPKRTAPAGMRFDPIRIYVDAGANSGQEREMRRMVRDYELEARVKIGRSKNMLQRLHKLSLEPSPDEQTVIAMQEEINKLQGEIQLDRIRLMLRLRAILNEEQRARLAELMAQTEGTSTAGSGSVTGNSVGGTYATAGSGAAAGSATSGSGGGSAGGATAHDAP
ncbi:MAG: periplasmic heavy metal sensor [Candidatus Obscuribacterales bacterium]